MRRLLPDTTAGWMVLVLLVVLVVSHLAAFSLYSGNRQATVQTLNASQLAERMAAAALALDQAEPDQRRYLARRLSGPSLRVMVLPRPVPLPDSQGEAESALRQALAGELGAGRTARVLLMTPEMEPPPLPPPGEGEGMRFGEREHMRGMGWHRMQSFLHGVPSGRALVAAVPLSGEGHAVLVGSLGGESLPGSLWRPGFLLGIGMVLLVLGGLSVWAVKRAARPLDRFAAAAERLGRDMAAPPLPETGPAEVRAAARSFNRMQDRLRRFIEDRTTLLAAISHDLRTPITRLRLRAEFIEDEEMRGKTLKDLEEMEAMIAQTLAFARDDPAREPRQPVDLSALLADLGGSLQGPAGVMVEGGPLGLRRAFGNLVQNALAYGGCADITLAPQEGEVLVTIGDRGPGIPADQRERVFAPFVRLEASRNRETGGTGLGLAVARSVIRAHGGEITLHDRDGGGLEVRVRLPRG